jgi:hypothetical protein
VCARAASRSPLRNWLRPLALLWGAVVLIGHMSTYGEYVRGVDLPPDLVQHLCGVGIFTLLYRGSWRFTANAAPGLNPTLAALLVCCGWSALCESLQLLVPMRDFQVRELALNTVTPAAVLALWWLIEQIWER